MSLSKKNTRAHYDFVYRHDRSYYLFKAMRKGMIRSDHGSAVVASLDTAGGAGNLDQGYLEAEIPILCVNS